MYDAHRRRRRRCCRTSKAKKTLRIESIRMEEKNNNKNYDFIIFIVHNYSLMRCALKTRMKTREKFARIEPNTVWMLSVLFRFEFVRTIFFGIFFF